MNRSKEEGINGEYAGRSLTTALSSVQHACMHETSPEREV